MRRPSGGFRITRSTIALLAGAVAVVVSCMGIILWVLSVATAAVDGARRDGERRLVTSVFDSFRNDMAEHVSDYANWNEIFDNFTRKRDAKWERENLGADLLETFDLDSVYVATEDGVIVYSTRKDGRNDTLLTPADLAVVKRLTHANMKFTVGDTATAATGVVDFGGNAVLAAVSAIHPASAYVHLTTERGKFYLIEVNRLTPEYLARIGEGYGLAGLRLTRRPEGGFALPRPDDKPSGYFLTWTPSKMGRDLFDKVEPAIVLIGTLLLAGFLALMGFWRHTVEHLRADRARALKAEIEATRARAVAAEETTRNKSAFVANMSHELRTPLNAIIGFSEFMECETLGPIGVPKYREYVGLIKESGHHLLTIINDILLISKVEAGKFTPRMERFELSQIMGDILRMMEGIAAKRNIAIVSTEACPGSVHADRQAVRQIVINILSNAVKFSPDRTCIEIACRPAAEGRLRLSVRDHGCGIPPETLRELGKPFVQAEDAYTRQHDGTGIGLAICYRLAAAMGATIEVQSAVNEGTTVSLLMTGAPAKPAIRAATA